MRNTLTENLLGSALTKVLWLTGSLLISLGLSSQAFAAASDTTEIEEVVVTGSYLKSNAADSPSPLSIVTSLFQFVPVTVKTGGKPTF